MSLSLSILASGSSGNCAVLRCGSAVMLIDCGIGPRTTAARLRQLGIRGTELLAICLTHLDSDHFNARWISQIVKHRIAVWCHAEHAVELSRRVDDRTFSAMIQPFNGEPFSPLLGVSCEALRLPHDVSGSHGFVVEGHGARIGWATDLGRVEEALIARFCGLNILGIESNYDPQMQRQSGRPIFLQQRIMGGSGHLSNQQAFAAVRAILDRCERGGRALPEHIVLLHRSRQCNCPRLVRRVFGQDGRITGRLTLAEQDAPTPWLAARPQQQGCIGEQWELQWSAGA
jgi:phosphoribosyl 1,2-cyclic phosphodiesterase